MLFNIQATDARHKCIYHVARLRLVVPHLGNQVRILNVESTLARRLRILEFLSQLLVETTDFSLPPLQLLLLILGVVLLQLYLLELLAILVLQELLLARGLVQLLSEVVQLLALGVLVRKFERALLEFHLEQAVLFCEVAQLRFGLV